MVKSKSLEGHVSKGNCRLGPYNVSPNVGLTSGELVVSGRGEDVVEILKRDWRVGESFRYFFSLGDRPESTIEIVREGEMTVRERVDGVSGFHIVEEDGRYFVEYTTVGEKYPGKKK